MCSESCCCSAVSYINVHLKAPPGIPGTGTSSPVMLNSKEDPWHSFSWSHPLYPKGLRNVQKLSQGTFQFQEALRVNGFHLGIHAGCNVLNSDFTLSSDLSGRELYGSNLIY